MKKNLCLFVMALVVVFLVETPVVFSQGLRTTSIKLGYFNPKGVKPGFIIGGSWGHVIDESVDVGIGVDFFRKTYKEETKIAKTVTEGKVTEDEIRTDAEFTTNIIPITAQINLKIRSTYLLYYYLTGGIGYEMMFNREKNFKTGDTESRFYQGFKWIVSAGILYQVGSRSALLGEIFYDGTKVSRNKKDVEGAPVRYEVDASGLGFRAGIRFGIL